MKCILHENQSPMQEIRNEATGKNEFKGNKNADSAGICGFEENEA